MGKPSIYQKVRQTLGRAFRETGQALDRAGIKGQQMAVTRRVIGDDPVIYQDHLSRHRQQMPLLRRGKPVVSPDVAFLAPCATLIGSVHIGAGSSVFYKSILRADNCDRAEAFHRNNDNDIAIGSGSEQSESTALSKQNDDSNNTSDAVVSAEEFDDQPATTASPHPEEWDLDPDRFIRNMSNATGGGIFIGEATNIQDGCIIDSTKDHTRIGNGVTVGHLASIHSATIHDHCLIGMGSLLQEGVVVQEESFIAAGANISKNTVVGSGELWVGNPARKIRDLTSKERERLHYQADAVSNTIQYNTIHVLETSFAPHCCEKAMFSQDCRTCVFFVCLCVILVRRSGFSSKGCDVTRRKLTGLVVAIS
jgi:carbonic anhydrase/acetyltransferase-like protein (isoleucine patch superfamily)